MKDRKFRIGQVVAQDVAIADILIDVPHDTQGIRLDQARIVGTVLHVHEAGETRHWTVLTGRGAVIGYPDEPVGRYVNTHVHVPWAVL